MNTSDLYEKDGGSAYHANKHTESDRTVAIISKFRAKKFRKYISRQDKVLEYGVGAGWNLREIDCAEKTGYDISTWLKPLVEKQHIHFINDARQIPTAYFDNVICHHVLEHVPDPMETLKEIRKYIKPDGRLLLFVPADTSARFNRFDPANKDHHLFTWNVQALCNLVAGCGYTIKRYGRNLYGFDRYISHTLARFNLPRFLFYPFFYMMNFIRPDKEIWLVCTKDNDEQPG